MGADTKIEWARHTFNPWIGCTKVAAACDHCYAEARMDHRFGTVKWGPHGERKRTTADYWRQPLKWNRDAIAASERPFVFCASLADVFDNQVPAQWRRDLFQLIWDTPQLVWLLLTKRPGNIVRLAEEALAMPKNVALGTSCGDQGDADRNIPKLLEAAGIWKSLFTFVSAEPLLGPIDFRDWLLRGDAGLQAIDPLASALLGMAEDQGTAWIRPAIDWVIVGGESGDSARPMHPDWARVIRDQCQAAGAPFLFKQWGTVFPAGQVNGLGKLWNPACGSSMRGTKAITGRLLDGRSHDDMPVVA